jgi:hypothetical protein
MTLGWIRKPCIAAASVACCAHPLHTWAQTRTRSSTAFCRPSTCTPTQARRPPCRRRVWADSLCLCSVSSDAGGGGCRCYLPQARGCRLLPHPPRLVWCAFVCVCVCVCVCCRLLPHLPCVCVPSALTDCSRHRPLVLLLGHRTAAYPQMPNSRISPPPGAWHVTRCSLTHMYACSPLARAATALHSGWRCSQLLRR